MLRKRVQQQTAAITAQKAKPTPRRNAAWLSWKQWRSRVLEDINSSRPLGDIVEHIRLTEMMSLHQPETARPAGVRGHRGPRAGQRLREEEKMRVISREIHHLRTGLVLELALCRL